MRPVRQAIEDVFDNKVDSTFWLYWRTMFAFENWHSALEMKLYFQRFLHHIAGLRGLECIFTRYNRYESLILPVQKYLEDARCGFPVSAQRLPMCFRKERRKKGGSITCGKVDGKEQTISLTEKDLVFVTNGSCTEGTIYGDQNHAPVESQRYAPRYLGGFEGISPTDTGIWKSGKILFQMWKRPIGNPHHHRAR